MAVRGSGIGASGVNLGSFATGIGPRTAGGGGSAVSPPAVSMYGPGVSTAAGVGSPTLWLLGLVVVEALALIALRQGTRHSHGG